MILYQWRGATRNFGDELNSILWPRLLPDFFDSDPTTRFIGIGSVLDARHHGVPTKLVAGSGYGGYEARPVLDASWIIHWVRGPRTARLLGLSSRLAVGDPAALLPLVGFSRAPEGSDIGFMPHFESLAVGHWPRVARDAGMVLIDPRQDPLSVLQAISRCRVLVSEAMHGVIVADALRVPWIAVRPLARIHRSKWSDWAATQNLQVAFHTLSASSFLELGAVADLAAWRPVRSLLDRYSTRLGLIHEDAFVGRATEALARIAVREPQLSRDSDLERCQARMVDCIAALQRSPYRAADSGTAPVTDHRLLHAGKGLAYHHGLPG